TPTPLSPAPTPPLLQPPRPLTPRSFPALQPPPRLSERRGKAVERNTVDIAINLIGLTVLPPLRFSTFFFPSDFIFCWSSTPGCSRRHLVSNFFPDFRPLFLLSHSVLLVVTTHLGVLYQVFFRF